MPSFPLDVIPQAHAPWTAGDLVWWRNLQEGRFGGYQWEICWIRHLKWMPAETPTQPMGISASKATWVWKNHVGNLLRGFWLMQIDFLFYFFFCSKVKLWFLFTSPWGLLSLRFLSETSTAFLLDRTKSFPFLCSQRIPATKTQPKTWEQVRHSRLLWAAGKEKLGQKLNQDLILSGLIHLSLISDSFPGHDVRICRGF